MNKDSTKLILSRLINKFGNVLYDYANSAWIVSFSNFGKSYLGLYQLADSITLILFNPTAGVLADRINRKKILLITDFISAFMCLLLCLINNNSLMIILLIFNNVILSVCSAFSSTAMKSFTPNVVKNSEMLSFNSVLETFLQLINVLSPIFCVFFYKTLGLRWTLFFNALTFLLSFFLILNIKVEKKIQLSTEKITIPIIWMDLTEGYKYIKRDSEIFLLLIISAFVNLFLACYNYLLPFTNTIYNDTNSFAIFLTTGAIGAVIGAILSKHIKNNMVLLQSFKSTIK
ncbi:MFS transporter [Streptococcus agalactiae]|uniref:MFS transporter n=1 Tax=Streptococcus agalactiae TaxID=1311 RepID=UPI0036253CAD